FFAFSFGPFIGFWSAYEAAQSIGAMLIPGGGMSAFQRLQSLLSNDATVLICTPTYALHLAEVASQERLDIAGSNVRITIHTGEPGASLPGMRQRIEQAWGSRSYDHAGATEVGAWGFECAEQDGVHANEGEFICEVINPATGSPAEDGELVITNLGRVGMPVIRYRTGDRVRLNPAPCACGRRFIRFAGGVIGRIDDLLIIGGVNVYPSAIENIVRGVPEVGEFMVDVDRRSELDQLVIHVEVVRGVPEAVTAEVAKRIHSALNVPAEVIALPSGSLPRFDHKARRFRDRRQPLL
ncbi:MAG: phenylacetate--CoA ligase, partial [Chloroflexales bacterium]|nr:phenylacetate--CoA ligase [Chloroflexales bacterium]